MGKAKINTALRNTGIKIVGHMPWGSHLCQFYHTKRDLLKILLPYFKAGLKSNEFCIWVTSEPLSVKEAKDALKKEIKNIDQLIRKGQIEILDYSQLYAKGGRFNADRVLAGWIERERIALRKGFFGLRLTGNALWLEKKDWKNFTEYEAKVNNAIGGHKMLALCTYSLDKCGASQVIDVVNNHQFALIKRDGAWASVESSSYRMAMRNLQEVTRKNELLIDNIPLHVAAIDRTGKFIVWNKYSEDLFGYKKKEAIARLEPKNLYLSSMDTKKVIRAAKEKGIFDGDIKLKRKGGSLVDMHLVVIPYRDERGNIINYYGFGENITERAKAEKRIAHLASFPEHNPNPVIEINFSGKTLYENPTTAKSRKELGLSDKSPHPLIPADLSEILKDAEKKGVTILEREIGIKDRVFIEVISIMPQFSVVRIYARDITDRKRTEQLLQRSHQELEGRVEERTRELKEVNENLEITRDNLNRAQSVAHIGSWHLDIINNVLVWSDETYRIFGLSIGSLLTYEKFLEIVHPNDREYVNKSWQAALQKAPYDIEHRVIVGGKVKWVREKAEVEFNNENRAVTGIGTVQDITEFKQQEESTRKLQEELTHVSRVTTMGELTAAFAHELNQPLMAIISNAQAAQRFLTKKDPDLNEIKDILADIIKDDKRASGIINKLRALLRKSEIQFTTLNINDVIGEVVSLVRSDTVINNISLRSGLNDKIPLVHGDRVQLQQVVLNLILNSFEAMKNADLKRLSIRVAQENDKFITVSVEDSGIGINDKNKELLFTPFFTTKKEGLGMGLSINKAIIEAHGGSLRAKNNSDKGATFYFTLPIAKENMGVNK